MRKRRPRLVRESLSGSAAGTISALSSSSITLHNDDATITCALGDGSPKLGGFDVGDKVKLTCADGVLTAIARLDLPADVQTALGTLTALSDASVTVHTDGHDVTCARGDGSPKLGDSYVGDTVKIACTSGAKADVITDGTGLLTVLSPTLLTVHADGGDKTCSRTGSSPSLDGFQVGDTVKFYCTNGVLTAIAKVNVTTYATGSLSALSADSLTVLTDGGARTCTRGSSSPSLDGYHVGDRVKMTCTNGVLTAIAKADVITDGVGVLTALSPTSLTVHTDGGDKTCSRTAGSPSLDGYQVGDTVKFYCTNGVLTAIAKANLTTYATGVLSALSQTSITVHTDGGDRTCSRTAASPSLDGYAVGNYVKATCVSGMLTAIQHL